MNKESKNLIDVPYDTVFSLMETVFAGYTVQSVTAIQTSDANGNPLVTPIDLQGQDGKGYTVKGDIEITYTNKLTAIPVVLKKIGYTNTNSNPHEYDLPGAVFTLYTSEEGTEIAKDQDGTELKNLVSGSDGIFFNGMLGAGTYYLEESVVPDGYYAPLGRFKLEVGQDSTMLTASWVSGSPEASAGIVTDYTDAGTGIKTYIVSLRNTAGVELPSAGGRGTKRLYVLGMVLIGFAIVLLRHNRAVKQ